MRPVTIYGDQLTNERMRGAHMARVDGDAPEERLEGLFASISDFHEKMNFLQVIMDRLYSTASSHQGGTLHQLRNLINRRNVVQQVSKNYHADSAFIDLTVNCHVVSAAMTHLNMANLHDRPAVLPGRLEVMSKDAKARLIRQISKNIVNTYIFQTMTEVLDNIAEGGDVQVGGHDGVYNYATALMKFGLLRRVSLMSTATGDGLRSLRHWKFALLAYHQTHKTKYRLESFLLQAAVKVLLPERLAQQVLCSRFVNLTGGEGNNLDADYVLELFNNKVKHGLNMTIKEAVNAILSYIQSYILSYIHTISHMNA